MTEISWIGEAVRALNGVARLARFDRAGAGVFGDDPTECARSFRACVWAYPFYLIVLLANLFDTRAGDPGLGVSLLTQSVAFLIECLIFPVAVLPVLRWYGREPRWPRLVAAYNWWGLGQTILVTAALGLHHISDGAPFSIIILMVVYLFCLIVEGFIFDVILETGLVTAATLVLIDLFLGHVVATIADAIAS